MRYDGLGCIKNMDYVFLCGKTLEEVKEKLEKFLSFCQKKNLMLKPSKLNISEQVEFVKALIVGKVDVACVLPKD